MSIYDFNALYEENPSRKYKAVVRDRTKFKTISNESRLTSHVEFH